MRLVGDLNHSRYGPRAAGIHRAEYSVAGREQPTIRQHRRRRRDVRRPWNRQRPLAFDRLVCRRGVSQHLCGGFGSGWHELRSLSGKLIRERMVIGCGLDLFNKQPKQE